LGIVVVVILGVAGSASADDTDLGSWVDRANAAEFSGRLVTVCETPDGERAEFVNLSQGGGVLVVNSGAGQSVVSPGEFYDLSSDGTVHASSVAPGSRALNDRYHAVTAASTTVLGRDADVVQILEGSLVRMELVFDRGTGAVVRSVAYNADGSIYCTSTFVSFSERSTVGTKPVARDRAVLVPVDSAEVHLPDVLSGFDRRELFEGPGGSIAAFYSDGLFSFTVLVADRTVHIAGLDDSHEVQVEDHSYQRAFLTGQAVYSWSTRDGGFVMLGDQPLDMQEAVLSELPKPGSPSIITRFWRRLFG
jgi:hypothetical protein